MLVIFCRLVTETCIYENSKENDCLINQENYRLACRVNISADDILKYFLFFPQNIGFEFSQDNLHELNMTGKNKKTISLSPAEFANNAQYAVSLYRYIKMASCKSNFPNFPSDIVDNIIGNSSNQILTLVVEIPFVSLENLEGRVRK